MRILALYKSVPNLQGQTNTAMLKVVNNLAQSIEHDPVDHEKLLRKLHAQYRFSSRTCKLIQSYLSDRFQRVKIGSDISRAGSLGNTSRWNPIIASLCLFINDMADTISIKVHSYADDTELYCSAPVNNLSAGVDSGDQRTWILS